MQTKVDEIAEIIKEFAIHNTYEVPESISSPAYYDVDIINAKDLAESIIELFPHWTPVGDKEWEYGHEYLVRANGVYDYLASYQPEGWICTIQKIVLKDVTHVYEYPKL